MVNLRGSEPEATETFGLLENMVNAPSSSSILKFFRIGLIAGIGLGFLGTSIKGTQLSVLHNDGF